MTPFSCGAKRRKIEIFFKLMLEFSFFFSGEGAQPGDGAEQQPAGAAAEGRRAVGHLPPEDDGPQHPVQPPLLPGGLQEGDRQQKGHQGQGGGGQQAPDGRHLLPAEAENVNLWGGVNLPYLYWMLFISPWEVWRGLCTVSSQNNLICFCEFMMLPFY